MIQEKGPWSVTINENPETIYNVCIQSEDFTHDVTLLVSGDFENLPQKQAYAEEIAKRLNLYKGD